MGTQIHDFGMLSSHSFLTTFELLVDIHEELKLAIFHLVEQKHTEDLHLFELEKGLYALDCHSIIQQLHAVDDCRLDFGVQARVVMAVVECRDEFIEKGH